MAGLGPRALLPFVLASLLARGARAETIRSSDPEFTITIPDRFGALVGTRPGAYAFADRGGLAASGLVITLRSLDGTLANEPITESQARAALGALAPNASVRVETVDALGVDIPVVVAVTPGGDAVAVSSMPTVPRALQLTVSGRAEESAAVVRTTREIVASLRARTNWLTRREIARRRDGRIALGIAWGFAIAFGIAYVIRFRRRRSPRLEAAWLALAGVAFASAAALLASVPKGSSAFAPLTPAILALVFVVNAVLQLRPSRTHRNP